MERDPHPTKQKEEYPRKWVPLKSNKAGYNNDNYGNMGNDDFRRFVKKAQNKKNGEMWSIGGNLMT